MSDAAKLADLYPPTASPSAKPLPLLPFLARFIRNPLRSLPQAVYQEPVVTYGRKRPLVAWVTDPELIEDILLSRNDIDKLRDVKHFFKSFWLPVIVVRGKLGMTENVD